MAKKSLWVQELVNLELGLISLLFIKKKMGMGMTFYPQLIGRVGYEYKKLIPIIYTHSLSPIY